MNDYKIIILLGQRVRSGTNFIGSTLSQHPDIITIPPDRSNGEFNLFGTSFIKDHYKEVIKKSFALGLKEEQFPEFAQVYFKAWQELIVKSYGLENTEKTIFIKSPIIENYDLWRLALPNAKIALLTRDGRDNVISSVKASNDKREWHTLKIKFKKRINFYSGRSFVNHSKHWAYTANIFHSITEDENTKKFKYEALNNSPKNIEKLLKFYELETNKQIINNCLKAPVIGSSWGVNNKIESKPNWKPDYDKSKYKFSDKWYKWIFFKRLVFKKLAGKELICLNFEDNNNW